jgi:hypothetical protein
MSAAVDSGARPAASGSRISEYENEIGIATIREFLKRVLAEDAVADQVNDLLFDHVVHGRLHPASSPPPSSAPSTSCLRSRPPRTGMRSPTI